MKCSDFINHLVKMGFTSNYYSVNIDDMYTITEYTGKITYDVTLTGSDTCDLTVSQTFITNDAYRNMSFEETLNYLEQEGAFNLIYHRKKLVKELLK
jgi:hypothetical protein